MHSVVRKDDVSYVFVVGGANNPGRIRCPNGCSSPVKPCEAMSNNPGERMPKFTGIQFSTTEEDRKWLSNYLVGKLKDVFPWTEIGNTIQDVVEDTMDVKYLGGDLIHLHPQVEMDGEPVCDNLFKWFHGVSRRTAADAWFGQIGTGFLFMHGTQGFLNSWHLHTRVSLRLMRILSRDGNSSSRGF